MKVRPLLPGDDNETIDLLSQRGASRTASRALSAISTKALSKDPADRYPTAEELAQDIRRYRDHLPVSACKPCLMERIVQDMEDQRWKQGICESMTQVRSLGRMTKDMQGDIEDLQKKVQAAADPQRAAILQRQLTEKLTAHATYLTAVHANASSVLTRARSKCERDETALDADVKAFLWELIHDKVRHDIDRGDLYSAHAALWMHLSAGNQLGRDDAQRRELEQLRERVETRLRELGGPDFRPPDWSRHLPERLLM